MMICIVISTRKPGLCKNFHRMQFYLKDMNIETLKALSKPEITWKTEKQLLRFLSSSQKSSKNNNLIMIIVNFLLLKIIT